MMVHIISIIILIEFVAGDVSSSIGSSNSNDIPNTSARSISTELRTDSDNTTNQRTHSDLIRSCSTFREILSEEVAYSCDYSMLYYKGQCELYSDILMQNETEAVIQAQDNLSFCSDSRVDKYIQEHGLTHAPRSPTLIPGYELPIA